MYSPAMIMMRVVRWPIVLLALASLAGLGLALTGAAWSWSAELALGGVGAVPIGFHVGVVQAVLLSLVAGVGVVVSFYSARNLIGQRRLTRFALLEATFVVALATTVTTTSLPLLAAAWTLGSLAISGLVAHSDAPEARIASRQVRARLLIGDAFLWAAVAVIGVGVGTWTVLELPGAVSGAPAVAVAVAGLLLVGAGIVRSALVPAHRWLPETAAAPSPVSALLHAGLVNGAGVIALLLWPLIATAGAARATLVLAGTVTALVATAQMRARVDVKGRLAASTSSQMGYLAVQVGLGLPVAALAHIVGHGVWKAAQFLGAGDAVARVRRADSSTGRPLGLPVLALTGAVAVVVVLASAVIPIGGWVLLVAPAELLPLAVAVGAAWLGLAVIVRSPLTRIARWCAAAVLLAGVSAYVLSLRGLTDLLVPEFGEPASWSTVEGQIVAVTVVALVALGLIGAAVDRRAKAGRLPQLARWAGRSSLRPARLAERLVRRPVVAQALPPVATADAHLARQHVSEGAAAIGSLYPLTSFVASNPLANLEDLGFAEATAAAGELWGARPGPSAQALRRALADGMVDARAIDAAADAELATAPAEIARRLMLDDSAPAGRIASMKADLVRVGAPTTRVVRTPMEAIGIPVEMRDRADGIGHHCCARSLSGASWPGASGPWAELRSGAATLDSALGVTGAAEIVTALPADPASATAALLEHLGVAPVDRPAVIGRLLARHPGWPAHLVWRERNGLLGREAGLAPTQAPDPTDLLVELVATRLALEVIAAEAMAPKLIGRTVQADDLVRHEPSEELARLMAAALGSSDSAHVADDDLRDLARSLAPLADGGLARARARALEYAYQDELLSNLDTGAGLAGGRPGAGVGSPAPAGQIVTCIDVRSERLRRHLEQVGPWETFGAAGFFGIPLRYESSTGSISERTPALLRPSVTVREHAAEARGAQGSVDALAHAVRGVETAPGLVFGWAEAVGWLLAPAVLARTAWPRAVRRAARVLNAWLGAPLTGHLEIEADVSAQAAAASAFLRTTGLVEFAPVVVLCGHGATVTNNPHVAAYDCGACGGAAGDVSARALCAALNDDRVRVALLGEGIEIPAGTLFVPALHDTTTDTIRVLEAPNASPEQARVLRQMESEAVVAGSRVRAERLPLLPDAARRRGSRAQLAQAERRGADWAQPRPEWGLAGAAAIVVGPRSLTAGHDLHGRVFLQSYRPELDEDGSDLQQLLAAPVVVAQWITSQYWASLTDPERFGAGDKTTHNVVGDGSTLSAVVSGARGDLRIGLPWQAVSPEAPEPAGVGDGQWRGATRHQPQRLLVVVNASPDRIESAIESQPSFGRLVIGEWIAVSAVDPETGAIFSRLPQGGWEPATPQLVAVG